MQFRFKNDECSGSLYNNRTSTLKKHTDFAGFFLFLFLSFFRKKSQVCEPQKHFSKILISPENVPNIYPPELTEH